MKDKHETILHSYIKLLQKELTMISVFMEEHNNFKKELVYNRAFVRPELVKQANICEGFLAKMDKASNGVLQISGLIDDSVVVGA